MDISESPPQEKKRPVSRLGLYLPFIVVFLLVAGWSLFWFFTADAASRIADGLIAREATRGREWSCPNRTLGGFPFRIEITCNAPRFTLQRGNGQSEQVSLGALSLHARILSPRHFIALATPPFRIRENTQEAISLGWDTARISFQAGDHSLTEASAEFLGLSASIGTSDKPEQRAKAKSLSLHIRQNASSTTGTDVVARIQDFSAPLIDLVSGNAEPLQGEFQATALGLTLAGDVDFRSRLEAWRMAQGKARILVGKVTKGAFTLDLTGELGLDDARRLEGNLQGRARGIDAITSRFGKQGGLDMGNLLGKMSGGQGIPVVLSFEAGKLRYGPFPLMNLMPVY